jgi:phosphoenolpyruvate-protein phosphotransferase
MEKTKGVILRGTGVSAGVALGPLQYVSPGKRSSSRQKTPRDPEEEKARFQQALQAVHLELDVLIARIREHDREAANIFRAYRAILEDPAFTGPVMKKIEGGIPAGEAVEKAAGELVETFEKLEDPYLRARAKDIQDLRERLLASLEQRPGDGLDLKPGSILLAPELTPTMLAGCDPEQLAGIVTAGGGASDHTAILCRSLGLPAVVGVGPLPAWVRKGSHTVAVDGTSGTVIINPSPGQQKKLQARQSRWRAARELVKKAAAREGATADGVRLRVSANLGGDRDLPLALSLGAEGIGLLRSEFLFLDRPEAPGEEEQYRCYLKLARDLDGRPLTIRTLDVGGDKPLNYLERRREANPFLGLRGIRFCLEHEELFLIQLRALLRAAVQGNIKLLLPMVADLEELAEVRRLMKMAADQLRRSRKDYNEKVPLGIMVETPAAALTVERLAEQCDFVSIGTNDLVAYTLAVDRTNRAVSHLYRPFHPAVIGLIKKVVDGAGERGIKASCCGDLAGSPAGAVLLAGLGVEELSMAPAQVPWVKHALSRVSLQEARAWSREAAELYGNGEAEKFLLAQLKARSVMLP